MLMTTSPSYIITVRQEQQKNQKKTMIGWRCVYCNQLVEGKDYQELYNQIVSLKVSDSSRCHAFRNTANITNSNRYGYAHRVSSTIPKCYDKFSETFAKILGNSRWYKVRKKERGGHRSYERLSCYLCIHRIYRAYLRLIEDTCQGCMLSMLMLVLIYKGREYVLIANPEFSPLFTTIVTSR